MNRLNLNIKRFLKKFFKNQKQQHTSDISANKMQIDKDALITKVDAARIFGISIPTLIKYMNLGIVPYTIIKGRKRLLVNDVINSIKNVKNKKNERYI